MSEEDEKTSINARNVIKPLSESEKGSLKISAAFDLNKPGIETYNDQVLEMYPFVVDFEIEKIEELFIKNIIQKGPIIEVGCGVGVLVEQLRAKGYAAYGVDILDVFGESWKGRKIDQFCYLGNVEHMPGVKSLSFELFVTRAFWDTAFDGKKNNPDGCFSEINRVLTIGGIFLPLAEIGYTDEFNEFTKKFGFIKLPEGEFYKDAFKKVENVTSFSTAW